MSPDYSGFITADITGIGAGGLDVRTQVMLSEPLFDYSYRTGCRLWRGVIRAREPMPPKPWLVLVSLQAPSRHLPRGSSGRSNRATVLPWSAMLSVGPIRRPVTIHKASASLGRVAILGSFPEKDPPTAEDIPLQPQTWTSRPATAHAAPLAGQWLAVSTHPFPRLPMCTVASASPQPLSLISPSWLGEASARLPSYSGFIYHVRMRADTGRHEDTVTPHAEHSLTQGGAAAKLPYSTPPSRHARPVEWR